MPALITVPSWEAPREEAPADWLCSSLHFTVRAPAGKRCGAQALPEAAQWRAGIYIVEAGAWPAELNVHVL